MRFLKNAKVVVVSFALASLAVSVASTADERSTTGPVANLEIDTQIESAWNSAGLGGTLQLGLPRTGPASPSFVLVPARVTLSNQSLELLFLLERSSPYSIVSVIPDPNPRDLAIAGISSISFAKPPSDSTVRDPRTPPPTSLTMECNLCHNFGTTDDLPWDLGQPVSLPIDHPPFP